MQAKTEDKAEWKSLSDTQDAAEKKGILIAYGQMTYRQCSLISLLHSA